MTPSRYPINTWELCSIHRSLRRFFCLRLNRLLLLVKIESPVHIFDYILSNIPGEICKQEGGTLWTCTIPEVCTTAKQKWMKGIRPEICSFKGNVPILCCEPEEKTPPTGTKSEQSKIKTSECGIVFLLVFIYCV